MWVWVNVVGKKKIEKKVQCKVIAKKEMNRKKLSNICETNISNFLIAFFVTASSSSFCGIWLPFHNITV